MTATNPVVERLRRFLFSPWGIVAVAAVLRVTLILTKPNRPNYADTLEYEQVALNVLHGHGLGVSPRAPLFPLELALAYLLGGEHNYVLARFVNLLPALLLVAVVTRLAIRVGGRAVGLWTGLAVACTPTITFVAGMLYPTTIYSLILAGAALAALGISERPTLGGGLALGLLIPLGWLTDPVMIAPALGLVAWLAFQLPRAGARLAGALAVTLAVAALVVLPYSRFQHSAAHGKTVFMEKAQWVLHLTRTDSTLAQGRQLRLPAGTPYVPKPMVSFLRGEYALFRAYPAAYSHDITHEFLHFFQPMPDRIQTQNQYSRPAVLWLGALTFLPLLLLAPVGLVAGRARGRDRALAAVMILATATFYSFFFTQTRYRIPVDSFFTLLAVLGLLRIAPGLARLAVPDAPEEGRPVA